MNDNIKLLQKKLESINTAISEHNFGDGRVWYKSHRNGPTGIGKTFEDLLGKQEDNLPLPDFHDIELKAHDNDMDSNITLFTKSPNIPKSANDLLRDLYGYKNDTNVKELHVSVKSTKQFNSKSNHYFQICDNPDKKAVTLEVFDDKGNRCSNDISIEWSYDSLENSLNNKLKTLAIIQASSQKYNGDVYYSYESIKIIHGFNLKSLLSALKDDKLIIDLRLGAYKSGKNAGKKHDHGTGFRLKYKYLLEYSQIQNL
ncbi:R.MvaI [Apilactobacillus kunkeei]|uniref:MvaI/BcnI family restriction endonuclease n=1 Tax=Apilactobacillus kunkeei TaxID=148814 RepID=UPI0006C60B49|nr:MvaI/BcnI family restriction endonuclease [Apilactobacillus kunkeei]KOY76034.1 R.MvaI [Apilactobacillus kunkeei]